MISLWSIFMYSLPLARRARKFPCEDNLQQQKCSHPLGCLLRCALARTECRRSDAPGQNSILVEPERAWIERGHTFAFPAPSQSLRDTVRGAIAVAARTSSIRRT